MARKSRAKAALTEPPDMLLSAAQVRRQLGGVSEMCIWRWQRDPRVQFPMPDLSFNHRNYYYAGTISRWLADMEGRQVASATPAGVGRDRTGAYKRVAS